LLNELQISKTAQGTTRNCHDFEDMERNGRDFNSVQLNLFCSRNPYLAKQPLDMEQSKTRF
jgi:hypothetical protein